MGPVTNHIHQFLAGIFFLGPLTLPSAFAGVVFHRSEIPIYAEIVKIGPNIEEHFFGVNVDLGLNKKTRLILDTGSQGVVLFRNISGALNEGNYPINIRYHGLEVEGHRTSMRINFSGVTRNVEVAVGDLVRTCCSTSLLEKFDGVLGIGSGGDLENPLSGFAPRWIIDLPRRSDRVGHLILDPRESELGLYTMLSAVSDTYRSFLVHGCLKSLMRQLEECHAIIFDTGSQSIFSSPATAGVKDILGDGYFMIRLDAKNAGPFTWNVNYVQGSPQQGQSASSSLFVGRLVLGWTAFRDFSVLYDYDHGTVGIRRRP